MYIRFIARTSSRELDHKPDFAYISHLLKGHVPGSHGVFFLPYLTGERFPIMDSHIRASFLGLSQDTSAADMAGSVLEGVAFSIRHGLELFNHPAVKLSIIGGRSKGTCLVPDLKQCNGPSCPRLQRPGPAACTCHWRPVFSWPKALSRITSPLSMY